MNQQSTLWRKVVYLLIIVAMLVPLSMLSMPASSDGQGGQHSGGKLSRMRSDPKINLSQANLGDIDPASETMKLATLGMRGVAANILWEKANYYKKTEDWSNLSATLEQITKLQPNFISVWQFQAWNLSYNVSVEFDDYHDRYYWVKRGINFLKQGLKHNEDHPRLLWDLGWFIGQKIGRADEHVQFRRLFREDDDYHHEADPQRTGEGRDNWLVSHEWFLRAQQVVDSGKRMLKGKSPLIFHSDPAMSLMNYAEALDDDGVHGERARLAWKKAAQAWEQYGNRNLLTSFGYRIRLNDQERKTADAQRLMAKLVALVGGLHDEMLAKRKAQWTDAERKAIAIAEPERTPEQSVAAIEAERKLKITADQLAKRIRQTSPRLARQSSRLARQQTKASQRAETIRRYRDIVNFNYWKTRAEFEQTLDALAARKLIYDGQQAHRKEVNLPKARRLYEEGMTRWRKVLDRFPTAIHDGTTGDDLLDVVKEYAKVLREIAIDEGDERLPANFILRDVIEEHDLEGDIKALLEPPEAEPSEETQDSTDLAKPSVRLGAPPEPVEE